MFPVMHPQEALRIARERGACLAEGVARARRSRPGRQHRARGLRRRAGWALVTVGLRLAVSGEHPLRP